MPMHSAVSAPAPPRARAHRMSGPTATGPEAGLTPPQDDASRKKLMRESGRNLNYIGEAKLMAVLAASVRHAVKRTFASYRDDDLVKVAGLAQRGFLHLLKNNGKAVRGLPVSDFVKEVQAERNRILRQREHARLELERLTRELDSRRSAMKVEREEFIQQREADGAELDERLVQEILSLFDGRGDVADLREAVTRIALRTVQEERDKAVKDKLEEHDREVENYQRRISKLTDSLSRTEEEIKRLASMKDVESGVSSLYRTVQGLSAGDEGFEQKKEMMAAIFEANLALQMKNA